MRFVSDILAKGGLVVDGSVTLTTTPNATVDTDKFLVQDGTVVKYRTGAEVLLDIGAQGALTLTTTGTTGGATLSGNTLNIPVYQGQITLTVTGSSGSSTLVGNTLNIPTYTLSGLGGVPTTRTITINGTTQDLSADRTWSVGTVTSVAALTLGTTGTDLNSSVATGTTTPVITLNVPTASAANRGALSAADWTTFNNKQNALTLTVTGNSGAATLIGATLNIPTYTITGLGGVPDTRTINGLALSSNQTFATGTTGTDFNIVSAGTVHTFNIPDADQVNRGFITPGTQTIGGAKTFASPPTVPSLYLANMGVGSGVLYYNLPENRVTLANYNSGGEIKFEVNGGNYTMTLNSDLTIELMGYTTNGFVKTSGGNGLLVIDTTTYTPTSTTLTINGTSFNLSANRTWNVGTVTSVGLTAPTGFSVSNSPVTNSGTIALSFASGYSLPTNASQTNWDTAYNSRISSLTTTGTSGAATLVANVLNIPQYQAQGNYITSLTGEATGSGPGATTVTLTNSAVIGKVLTGLSVTSGAVVATDSILQAFGKVQGQINALAGGLQFQGTWNANTNTPTITSGVGTTGHFYIVNTAGNTTIDGNTGWQVGDWILFDGTVWQKVDNTDAVTSVNGLTGAVVLTTTNISEGTNLYYTNARARQAISLTTTGSSGAATYSNVTGVLNIPQYTLTGLGGVPSTRTITINGVAQDLSADRSWSVGTVTSIATTGPITGGTITGSGTIGITQSSSTTSGFLSSTDWNTFNNKQNAITLTTTGSSGSSTLVGATLNIPSYTLSGLGGVPDTRTLTINGTSFDLTANRTWSVGTVTSITFSGPLTGGTITGSGTVGITQASGSASGFLSSTDWTTFNSKQNAITLTTTGSSGAATFVGATLNIPNYTLSGLGGVPSSRTLTINGTAFDLSADRSWSVGTVTSVAALTLGTSGTDLSSSVATGTTTPVITLNVPTASATNRGALSSADWTTFNNKQNAITLTVTGSSGSATLVGATLNIPTYTLAGLGGEPAIATGTTSQYWRGDKSWQTLNTTAVTEGTNLYFTNARARQAISLTTTGTSGAATYDNTTGILNIPQYQSVLTNPVTGTGTTSYVARWTSSSTIGTGVLYDNGTNVGISLTTPQKKLDVNGSGIVASIGGLFSVGSFAGLHFGYSESSIGNDLYKKSALVFERTDAYTGQGGNAGGKIHFLLNNTGSASATSLSSAVVTIDSNSSGTNGSVRMGVGTTSPTYTLHVVANSNQDGFFVSAADSSPFTAKIATFRYAANGNDISIEAQGGKAAIQARAGASTMDLLLNSAGSDVIIGSTTNSGLAKLQVSGAIQQTSVTSSMLKTNSSGVLVAAVAGTDYLTSTSTDFSYAASLTLSTTWQDTGVSATNLSTSGVYMVTCALNDFAVSGGQYTETYVGLMYWYAGSTNSTNYSEIALHHSGHADNDRYIYLRTRTDLGASTAKIYLQIKGNGTNSGASTYTFTFKRLM